MQINSTTNVISGYSNNYGRQNSASSEVVFKNQLRTEGEDVQRNRATRADILRKFPNLCERGLDEIIENYNIETMSSSELYKLADELMKKNVIPPYAHHEGLELIAVYPKSLYDAVKNGDTSSMAGGKITVAPDYLYTVNQGTNELTYHGYPEFGLKNLQYGIHLNQEAFKVYDSYYTNEERNRALQIEQSKKAFYDFASMISEYQANARLNGSGNSVLKTMSGGMNYASSTSGGNKHITIRLGYLYSSGNPATGQELHMKYDESSTKDNPVMLVEGKDIEGKVFTQKIYLNKIDVTNASTTEITALNVHLAEQGDESIKNHLSMPLATMGNQYDVNDKMNFQTIFEQWAESLYGIGYDQTANAYMSELERYMFFKKM